MSWGSGKDYSMILHAVEDNINDVINISDSDNDDENMKNDENNVIVAKSDNEFDDDMVSTMSASGNMRLEFQLDDAKLKIEELRDNLNIQSDEFNREKDKYLRQLQFMENENKSLKSQLSSRTESYYETKKKLQSVLRSSEAEKKKLQTLLDQSVSQNSSTTSSTAALYVNRDKETNNLDQPYSDEILAGMEEKIRDKSVQVKNLTIKNAELEEKCTQLQQQLLVARSESGDKDDFKNMRQLQAQVRELEFCLRQKNRDLDKLEKSVKNAHVLEQELSTANSKVSSLQESIKSYRLMEVEHASLLEEKKSWAIHFKDILVKSSASCGESGTKESAKDAAATPVMVLRLLSNIQSKCANLLYDKGLLENKMSELSNSQRRSELQVQRVELELSEKQNKIVQLEKSNSILKQQAKLYEGEVMSLRSLLKTFDTEITILGNKRKRPRSSPDDNSHDQSSSDTEVSVLLNLKNKEIEDLRKELDNRRVTESSSLRSSLQNVEGKAAPVVSASSEDNTENQNLKRTIKLYKGKIESLKEEMFCFQKCAGFDFLPEKTRILHVKENPSRDRFQSVVGSEESSRIDASNRQPTPQFATPLEELKHLKKLIKTGKLVPPSTSSSSEIEIKGRSDSTSSSGSLLDNSLSMNASRANISMSTGGVDSQKMNQRLKEVFREKIAEYREAVYLLFGYKVDLMPADSITGETGTSMLKLRSMYAESRDDCLKFIQRKNRDGLEILESPFANGLDDAIVQSLKTSNSVPVFLSEITLDLFGKQTFQG